MIQYLSPATECGKVMFSAMSVCSHRGEGSYHHTWTCSNLFTWVNHPMTFSKLFISDSWSYLIALLPYPCSRVIQISQLSIQVLVTEALLNLKYNKRNKLFEKARPLRLVAPLSVQVPLKNWREKWRENWVMEILLTINNSWCNYIWCICQLELPINLTKSKVLQ